MPAAPPRPPAARLVAGPVVLLAAAVGLGHLGAQPPDPGKKAPEPAKSAPTPKAPPAGIKLPDGTFLWTGPGTVAGDGERVLLTPQELQKILDQVDQLKKQLAARRPAPPSGCALRARVEKRGETLVAAVRATYAFRTAAPNSAVALGGRRGFLVAATLDKNALPVLDTGEDGFTALVETPGNHTLVLDLEAPVTGRGTKAEVGFDLGLPRAAITTLAFDPPADVRRVNLTTRTPDPAQPGRPAEPRRQAGVDVGQLAPGPGHENGQPLGPVDWLEVTWDPPAAAAPASDRTQTAELDVTCLVAEGFVETTAKVRPRGPAREWRLAAPADATVTVDRVGTPAADAGPPQPPTVTKPADPKSPVWAVELPEGSAAADWVVTALVRRPRPKDDPGRKGPFPVGPFAVLGAARQTGTVRVTAAPHTRLTFRHGPDVRQDVPPGPAEEGVTAAFFRLATGPTGTAPPAAPLLEVEARPLLGQVRVRPAYKLKLTEAGWQVRAEVRVAPVRTAVEQVVVEVPAEWKGVEASPPELVEGVQPGKGDGPRQALTVQLAAAQRQPFELVLTATVPVPPAARDAAVSFPRFPGAGVHDATVQATVPDGLEVRGTGREWDGDQPAGFGQPLVPPNGPDGKPPKAAAEVAGTFEHGLARADLAWHPYRPELTAEVRADVTVQDRQAVVEERVRLRSPDGFGRPVRFRGPPGAAGVRGQPHPLDPVAPGEWAVAPGADARDVTLRVTYAVPLPARPADDRGPWKVPVGLFWPVGATRTESAVRVWSASGTGRAIAAEPGVWREMPPEPAPDREALPALTLAGSGAELPLVLDVRDAVDPATVAVWVERGLVQVWAADDGSATARARFLLKRWLAGSVEVRLPGPSAEVFLDGRKVEVTPAADPSGARSVWVPLPEPRPGRTAVLEVRYLIPVEHPDGDGARHTPPQPRAAFAGPVRWQVTAPPGRVPLAVGGGARPEQRWAFRAGLFAPGPAVSDADLDQWFTTGADPGGGSAAAAETAVLRLPGPEPVLVYHVSRVGLVVSCSLWVLLVGLVVSRMPGAVGGPVVAVLGGVAALFAVLLPQPAGQLAAAAGPGVVGLVVLLAGQAAARWYYRRRVTYLPGFARTWVDPVAAAPSAGGAPSGRGRGSQTGSAGSGRGEPADVQAAPSGT